MGAGRQLEIDHVSKRYGDVVALQDMTFEVAAGELFGFVGSNGAGKTTTMRIALGVLAADAGEVRWDGAPIDLQVRRRVGYMPEERGLYPRMQVGEQLVYLARLHGLGASQAAPRRGHVDGAPGRRRRAATTTCRSCRWATSSACSWPPRSCTTRTSSSSTSRSPGLDPVAVDVMSEVLRERRAAGVPVIFSSHQLDLVERLCDRVGIVRAGTMVASGTVDELRTGGPAQLVVDAPAAPGGWADGLPGVTVRVAPGHAHGARAGRRRRRPAGPRRRAGHRPRARVRPPAARR